MYDTKYNKIPKEVLITIVLNMGRVIRDLDPAGSWAELYWTNDGNETGPAYNHALENAATDTKECVAKYKKVSLIVNTYVCPDTSAGVARAKEALIADYDTSVKFWDVEEMLVVEDEVSPDAKSKVPSWLWEDLAEVSREVRGA